MLNWIKLEEGAPMPDYDVFVLWRTETGNYHVDCIDKDDDDWWNGVPNDDPLMSWPRCTHYAYIPDPDEELPREAEKHFNDEQNSFWGEIAVQFSDANTPTIERMVEVIEWLKRKYIISRK